MSIVRIRVSNVNSAVAKLQAKERGIQRSFTRAAKAGAKVAKAWIEEDMATIKTGISYSWLPTKPSSAPGETPAIQSQELIDSLELTQRRSATDVYSAIVSVGTEYAAALEFGSTLVGIAPRPYMRPAITRNEDKIVEAVANVVRRAIRNA